MRTRAPGVPGFIARSLTIALAIAAAGCSAEVTRFSYNGSQTTGSIPVPDEPVGKSAPPRGLGVTEAPLPPPDATITNSLAGNTYGTNYSGPPPAAPPQSGPAGNYRVVGRTYKTPPPTLYTPQQLAPPKQQPTYQPTANAPGDTVEVQAGDTLYSIAQRHGVAVAAVKDINGLSSDSVRPGQRLVLPADARDRMPVAASVNKAPPAPDRFAKYTPTPPAAQPAQPAVEAPPGWEGRYVMKNGDTLHGIALQHRVSLEELKRANGITDPTKVWAGTVLNVPAQSAPAVGQAPSPQNTVPRVVQVPPRIINAAPEPTKAAIRSDAPPAAIAPPPEAASAKFNWPLRGRVIAGFGKRPDGTHNDGVNVAVAQGTPIHAIDSGKVAYAGNELKGYGNLVLIRHANGWVSAYAHADQILVRPNDEVRRGQMIARAGKTGSVDQPQLHFELRQGSRPVDPVPHLPN